MGKLEKVGSLSQAPLVIGYEKASDHFPPAGDEGCSYHTPPDHVESAFADDLVPRAASNGLEGVNLTKVLDLEVPAGLQCSAIPNGVVGDSKSVSEPGARL